MRVVSELADIQFNIGRVSRRGNDLLVESDPHSTLETRITITPSDALATIAKLLRSPSALLFTIGLPFFWFRSRGRGGNSTEWEARRQRTGLNKPW